MTQELSKNLVCIQIRSGVEIWIEKERASDFMRLLASPNAPQFTECDGNLINRADIVGIFSANVMQETTRRKNKEWQCNRGNWHKRDQECGCRDVEISCVIHQVCNPCPLCKTK